MYTNIHDGYKLTKRFELEDSRLWAMTSFARDVPTVSQHITANPYEACFSDDIRISINTFFNTISLWGGK